MVTLFRLKIIIHYALIVHERNFEKTRFQKGLGMMKKEKGIVCVVILYPQVL